MRTFTTIESSRTRGYTCNVFHVACFHLDQINRLVDILVHLLPAHAYQNFTLQCFTEVVIVALTSNIVSPPNGVRVKMYNAVIGWLRSTVPCTWIIQIKTSWKSLTIWHRFSLVLQVIMLGACTIPCDWS